MNLLENAADILSDAKDTCTNALSNVKERVCTFWDEDTSLTRRNLALICILFALIGVIYGFLLSPVKKGIQVNITNVDDEDED
ncbi:MAG: hypothetical protein IJ801_07530 [Lachnospiraceae bacterium]|nr:hypothetical protein [Lachnospiraceae bacterium]